MVSARREFFGNGPETFRHFAREIGGARAWRPSRTREKRDFRACETQVVNSRKLQDWLAGAAGKEAGASAVIIDGEGAIRIALAASTLSIRPTNHFDQEWMPSEPLQRFLKRTESG